MGRAGNSRAKALSVKARAMGCAEPPDPSMEGPDWKPGYFTAHEDETVTVLARLMVPDTPGPGGKHAYVNRYIDLIFRNAVQFKPETKPFKFRQGLRFLDELCVRLHSKPFIALGKRQQSSILARLTRDRDWRSDKHQEMFHPVNSLIKIAYFSSRVGLLNDLGFPESAPSGLLNVCSHPHGHRPRSGKKSRR